MKTLASLASLNLLISRKHLSLCPLTSRKTSVCFLPWGHHAWARSQHGNFRWMSTFFKPCMSFCTNVQAKSMTELMTCLISHSCRCLCQCPHLSPHPTPVPCQKSTEQSPASCSCPGGQVCQRSISLCALSDASFGADRSNYKPFGLFLAYYIYRIWLSLLISLTGSFHSYIFF